MFFWERTLDEQYRFKSNPFQRCLNRILKNILPALQVITLSLVVSCHDLMAFCLLASKQMCPMHPFKWILQRAEVHNCFNLQYSLDAINTWSFHCWQDFLDVTLVCEDSVISRSTKWSLSTFLNFSWVFSNIPNFSLYFHSFKKLPCTHHTSTSTKFSKNLHSRNDSSMTISTLFYADKSLVALQKCNIWLPATPAQSAKSTYMEGSLCTRNVHWTGAFQWL